jgi:hypothetical protein
MPSHNNEDILSIYSEKLYVSPNNIDEFKIVSGNFEQKVLVLFLENDLNTTTDQLLQKMMAGCKLTSNDYYFVALKTEMDALKAIQHFNPAFCILFGVQLRSEILQLHKEPYKPFRYNSIKFVVSDPLSVIVNNEQLKASLWKNGLKILFQL